MQVMVLLQTSHRKLLDQIVQTYSNYIFGIAYSLSQNREIALETAQDVFLALARKPEITKELAQKESQKQKAYLAMMTHNIFMDVISKQAQQERIMEKAANNLREESFSDMDASIDTMLLQEAVERLEEQDLEAVDYIMLRFAFDLSVKEIARQKKLTASAVSKRISKAVNQLKQIQKGMAGERNE